MRKSPETLAVLLNFLIENPHWASAARRIGVVPVTILRWLKRSREGDPEFVIEWGGEMKPFHEHAQDAMKVNIANIESMARKNAEGYDEVVTFQGQVQYKIDPQLVGVPDDELRDLGYPDRYLRDGHGAVIPLTVRKKPSDQLVIKMLTSHMRRVYGEEATLNINHGGVLRLERPGEITPKAVAQTVDADFIEVEKPSDEQAGTLALGRPARDADELDAWDAAGEFKPSAVTFVDADGKRTVHIAQPLIGNSAVSRDDSNPMRQAMMAELAKQQARVAEQRKSNPPPAPPPSVTVHGRIGTDDEIDDTTGKVVKPAPVEASAVDNRIQETVARKMRGDPLSAIDRQIVNAVDRGDMDAARKWIAPERVIRDSVGTGTVRPGGYRSA
jgi:hypothetical protein